MQKKMLREKLKEQINKFFIIFYVLFIRYMLERSEMALRSSGYKSGTSAFSIPTTTTLYTIIVRGSLFFLFLV